MSEDQIRQVRATVTGLWQRAQADPSFMGRATSDPEGVLREAGVPDDAIAEFAPRMRGDQTEVAGYSMCLRYETGDSCCWGRTAPY